MRTPGPWTWDERDGYVDGPPGAGTVAYDVGHDEDGRLMASAPELLEALDQLWMWAAGEVRDTPLGSKVRSALAKAKGESEGAPAEVDEGASR